MDKEKILEMSRKENKNKDIYEMEVAKESGKAGAVAAGIIASIFFIIQILLGEGMNYGLYAIVFSVSTAGNVVRAIRLKSKKEAVGAVLGIILILLASAAHIMNLLIEAGIIE